MSEIVADFLTARRASLAQAPERLRRGRGVFSNNVWHIAGYPLTTIGVGGFAINTLIATPFLNGPPFPLRAIGFNVDVIGGAGSVTRVGIYAADDDRVYPTTLLLDSGSIDTTVGGFKNTPISLALDLGLLYFFVSLIGVAAPTLKGAATSMPSIGWADGFASAPAVGWTVAQAFGALPAVFPAGAALHTGQFPLVGVLGG